MELCDGRTIGALGEAYVEAMEGSGQRDALLSQLSDGIEELLRLGIVRFADTEQPREATL